MRTKTDEYIDTNNISFHGVRRVEFLELYFKGTDTRISIWISLCHSGIKGPAVSSVLKNSDLQ